MIIPDANVLIYAMNADAPEHERAWEWWRRAQSGHERIGLAWSVAVAYVRLMTNPRIMPSPLPISEAISDLRRWLASPLVDVLTPGAEHLHMMERLLAGRGGELISDAHLAALAMENGGTVYSADSDFARFADVRWVDPLAPV